MSLPVHLRSEENADIDRVVAEYLAAHHDYFERHPELLAEMTIAHDAGATSLLERQVSALRDQGRQLHQRFRDLVNNARENEDLGRRLHQLTLALMGTSDVRAVLEVLRDSLVCDFRVERLAVLIFGGAAGPEAGSEFRSAGAREREPYDAVIAQQTPVCGRLKRAQLEAAFGVEVGIGSGLVVPIGGTGWTGVLVIGAEDPRRYAPDMGTEMLAHLGDLASLALNPYLRQ